MIKIENDDVMGWEHAIRGMRNPMNSWDNSDSTFEYRCSDCIFGPKPCCDGCRHASDCEFRDADPEQIGPNDHDLMMKLRNAGTDHRKFMRMIAVYVDITAPLYWWKEFDTYKVGTVANSCSTMHKIHEKEFTLDDFSHEHIIKSVDMGCEEKDIRISPMQALLTTIECLNGYRELFIKTRHSSYWHQMIQLLPSSYNQKRTIMLNYEVLANIYKSRKNHKLDEWRDFCDWIKRLPYSELITGEFNVDETDKSLKFNSDKNVLGHVKRVEKDDHGVKFIIDVAKLHPDTGYRVDVTDENVLGEINTCVLNRSHLVHVFQSVYNAAKTEEEKRVIESLYNKICKENKEE